MSNAPKALSLTAPLSTQLFANYAQSAPADNGGAAADPSGPHGHVISRLDVFKPLIEKTSSDPQATTTAAPLTTPYSTDAIPQEVQNDPMAQLPPEDLNRMQSFSTSYRDSRGGEVRDRRAIEDGTVGDRRAADPATSTVSSEPSSGQVTVRDHRHSLPESLPPAAAPLASGSTGTGFTSAADYDKLNQANSNLEDAKQAALDDPTNPAKQLAFQEAAQALQLLINMLTQLSSMKASLADAAIKSSKVNAA